MMSQFDVDARCKRIDVFFGYVLLYSIICPYKSGFMFDEID